MTWFRRIVASIGIGAFSYAIMLGIMVVSVLFDKEAAPVITFASDTGRGIVSALDTVVSGSHWGQVAVNHLRERVNMTHVVLSIPASRSSRSFISKRSSVTSASARSSTTSRGTSINRFFSPRRWRLLARRSRESRTN